MHRAIAQNPLFLAVPEVISTLLRFSLVEHQNFKAPNSITARFPSLLSGLLIFP